MMNSVFILWHTNEFEDGHEDVKLIGVYSTRQRATEALERVRDQPGFRDRPAGFEISERAIDARDDWQEGYVTVELERPDFAADWLTSAWSRRGCRPVRLCRRAARLSANR